MEKNPLRFFRIQKTDRYVRFKFGQFNIYFSWHALRTRQYSTDKNGRKVKRKALKRRLLEQNGGGVARYAERLLCGKPLLYTTVFLFRKTRLKNLTSTISSFFAATATCGCIR